MAARLMRDCDGLSRRGMIQAGLGGLVGLSLSDLLRLRSESAERTGSHSKTAVIYLEMAGGPTQHETWDPKPLAPSEYRGPLNAIKTSIPRCPLQSIYGATGENCRAALHPAGCLARFGITQYEQSSHANRLLPYGSTEP